MSISTADNWREKYGEVVWARFGSYPWWPSFIYDPEKLPTTSEEKVKIQAFKSIGKRYVVYFYGDTSYGFIDLANIKPYNESTKAQFSKQVMKNKKYQASFPNAMILADREVVLDKKDRISWHYVAPKDETIINMESNHEDNVITPKLKKQKLNRKDSVKVSTKESSDNLYFCEENAKYEVNTQNCHIEDVDELDETKEEVNIEESYEFENDSDFPVKHKRKLKQKSRQSSLSTKSHKDEDEYSSVSKNIDMKPSVGLIKHLVNIDNNSVVPTTIVSTNKTNKNINSFEKETLVDRLIRFNGIINVCTNASTANTTTTNVTTTNDIPRALKILDKLFQINVTKNDLISSGLGKTVTELRRFENVDISEKAEKLRSKWKSDILKESNLQTDGKFTQKTCELTLDIAKKKSIDDSNVPDNTLSMIVRKRAVRLLQECIENKNIASDIENIIAKDFGLCEAKYFEFITRLAFKFKNQDKSIFNHFNSDIIHSLIKNNFQTSYHQI